LREKHIYKCWTGQRGQNAEESLAGTHWAGTLDFRTSIVLFVKKLESTKGWNTLHNF